MKEMWDLLWACLHSIKSLIAEICHFLFISHSGNNRRFLCQEVLWYHAKPDKCKTNKHVWTTCFTISAQQLCDFVSSKTHARTLAHTHTLTSILLKTKSDSHSGLFDPLTYFFILMKVERILSICFQQMFFHLHSDVFSLTSSGCLTFTVQNDACVEKRKGKVSLLTLNNSAFAT